MPSLAFVSPKGGVGKSTAALLLALGLAAEGRKVAVIDADPNKPLQHWFQLPGRPAGVSVHPAPMSEDVSDALREARRREPDWLIFDTEGSIRGAMGLRVMQVDLVLTPVSVSPIEVLQAIKASELVAQFGSRSGRPPRHLALLTRLPPGVEPGALRSVVEQLRARGMGLLPTPLLDQASFRRLFADEARPWEAQGEESGAARRNAAAYVAAVREAAEPSRENG